MSERPRHPLRPAASLRIFFRLESRSEQGVQRRHCQVPARERTLQVSSRGSLVQWVSPAERSPPPAVVSIEGSTSEHAPHQERGFSHVSLCFLPLQYIPRLTLSSPFLFPPLSPSFTLIFPAVTLLRGSRKSPFLIAANRLTFPVFPRGNA